MHLVNLWNRNIGVRRNKHVPGATIIAGTMGGEETGVPSLVPNSIFTVSEVPNFISTFHWTAVFR